MLSSYYWHLLILPSVVLALSTTNSAAGSYFTPPPAWLTTRLAEFDLHVHDFPTTGRGLQTTRDRQPGEVLIKVPEAEAVTVSSLLKRYSILAQAAETSMKKEDGRQQLTDEQILAVGLLLLRQDKDRYVTSLPSQHSVLKVPMLCLSFLPLAYQKLIQAYREHCDTLRESVLEVLPPSSSLSITKQDFQWAFATVRSRCVGMDGQDDPRIRTGGQGEIRVLLPGFDLLNHQFGAKSTPGYSADEKAYIIKSNDGYKAHDQVFISYSDQRNNLQMLMTYGFCIPGNPERVVLFDVTNLLEACATARPQYFSPTVLQQIWQLMGKLGKQRELYGWGDDDGQPQGSLQQGLQMMAELEQQFVTEPDETFGEDVVAALVQARHGELLNGIQLIQQEQEANGIEESWAPLVDSMKVLLEEEVRYLGKTDDICPDELD